jgi:hypothetical protein
LGALALYACSTYDNSLLSGLASGGGGTSAGAGSNSGGASNGGSAGVLINGGAPTANAGSIGVAGESGEAGDAGAGNGGSVAGSGPSGGASGGANTAGGTAGTGAVAGSSGGAGAAAAAGAGATAGSSYGGSGSLELIDDFEQHSPNIILLHGRNGPWYVFNDGTAGGVQSPFTIAAVTGAGASPGSTAALHMTATGFKSWGAGVGADFVNTALKKVVYDVSPYSGVSFYAKIGTTGSTTSLKVLFPDAYSDPDGGKCGGTTVGMECNDHLFLAVTGLSTTWAVYQVLFSKLGQVGYGLPQSKLDPTSVYSVQFTQSNTLPIDLWIDDLSFIVK